MSDYKGPYEIKVPRLLLTGTPIENVRSILRHGLLPGKGESGASFTKGHGALYFTDNMSAACDYSTGSDARSPIAVLVIKTEGLEIFEDQDDLEYFDGNLPTSRMPAGAPDNDDDDLPPEIDSEGFPLSYWHHSFMCRCAIARHRIEGAFFDRKAVLELGLGASMKTDKVTLLGCDGYPERLMRYYAMHALKGV